MTTKALAAGLFPVHDATFFDSRFGPAKLSARGFRTSSATREPALVDLAAFPVHEVTFFDSRFGPAKHSTRGLRTSTTVREPVVVNVAAARGRLSVFADSDLGHTLGHLPAEPRSSATPARGVHASARPARQPAPTAATQKQASFSGELGHTAGRSRPASSLLAEDPFPAHEAGFPDSRFDRFPVHEAGFPDSRYQRPA